MDKLKIEYDDAKGHQVKDCELGMFNTAKIGAGTVPISEAGFWFKAFNPGIRNVKTQIVQVT